MAFTKVLGPGIHTLANVTSHNINSSGVVTATKFVGPFDRLSGDYITGIAATFTGNVSIGGTLTYMDVTNVDAVGIITAQEGIHFGIGATAGKFLASTGITTIASLKVGNLTSGNVTYAGSGGELIDSSNLTFNGSDLLIDATTNAYKGVKFDNSFNLTFGSSSGSSPRLYLKGTSNSQSDAGDTFLATGTGGEQWFQSNTFTAFKVNADGTAAEALRITSDGVASWRGSSTVLSGTSNSYSLNIYKDSGSGYGYLDCITASTNHTGWKMRAYHNGSYRNVIAHSTSDYTWFETGGSERLKINSSGQIITGGGSGISFNNVGNSAFGSFFEINGGRYS